MLRNFLILGKASFICGGQWGSEAKGAAAAWVAAQRHYVSTTDRYEERFDIVTTNAGAQAGHTSIHNGKKSVVFHLPTAPLIAPGSIGYLNAGAIIDPDGLRAELDQHDKNFSRFYIHPNAAIITQDCRDAEGRADSAQTAIASTRKGVGEALARKILRSGFIAGQHEWPNGFKGWIKRFDLNAEMQSGKSVLVEVPQGIGLSLNGSFYPHCTSRDCTPAQAASDAGIHPSFVGPIMLVLRTFPIRVGNILETDRKPVTGSFPVQDATTTVHRGYSGGCYPDQREITWDELGVAPEITTVTKRVRRVFTWSQLQVVEAMQVARPTHVFLSHVDYLGDFEQVHSALMSYLFNIRAAAAKVGISEPQIVYSTGPTTADVHFAKV